MIRGLAHSIFLVAFTLEGMTGHAQVPSDHGGGGNPAFTEATLCIHNGGDFYYTHSSKGNPNQGGGKYFPSFTHWTATSLDGMGLVYPWKIRGWGWAGAMGKGFGPTWYWESILQHSTDNPYASTMTWDYPVLFCIGTVPHTGAPMPLFAGMIPSTVPVVGNHFCLFPSSLGGWNGYLTIFAVLGASWVLPSVKPFYGYEFGMTVPCSSALTAPSSDSIWAFVWNARGPYPQYLIFSGDETDCAGGKGYGNKGRNYSIIAEPDWGWFWYWQNGCVGTGVEWAMCLFVCDAVTIPVNVPGSPNTSNPFAPYGFDVGSATLTPYLSSYCAQLGFMTQDGSGIGGGRVVLAAMALGSPIGPYGSKNYRIPQGYDLITNLFLNFASLFMHTPAPGYPSCMFGTTTGAHSAFMPLAYDPCLLCSEIRFSSYALAPGAPMSASYMATYF